MVRCECLPCRSDDTEFPNAAANITAKEIGKGAKRLGQDLLGFQIGDQALCDLVVLLPHIAVLGKLALVVQKVVESLLRLLSNLHCVHDGSHPCSRSEQKLVTSARSVA